MKTVRLAFGWCAAAIVSLIAPAYAEGAPVVRVFGELPFSEDELQRAIALRISAAAVSEPIEVRALAIDAVEIAVLDKRRAVALLGQRGAQAARTVALAVADLLRDEVSVPLSELPPLETATRAAARPVITTSIGAVEVALDEPESPLYTVATLLAVNGFNTVQGGALIEATLRIRGSLRAHAQLGLMTMPARDAGGATVKALAFPLRAGAAWHFETLPLEVRADLALRVLSLSAGDATNSFSESYLLAGGGASAAYYLPLAGDLQVALALGADAFPNRKEFIAHGDRAFITEAISVWAGAGVTFGGAP